MDSMNAKTRLINLLIEKEGLSSKIRELGKEKRALDNLISKLLPTIQFSE